VAQTPCFSASVRFPLHPYSAETTLFFSPSFRVIIFARSGASPFRPERIDKFQSPSSKVMYDAVFCPFFLLAFSLDCAGPTPFSRAFPIPLAVFGQEGRLSRLAHRKARFIEPSDIIYFSWGGFLSSSRKERRARRVFGFSFFLLIRLFYPATFYLSDLWTHFLRSHARPNPGERDVNSFLHFRNMARTFENDVYFSFLGICSGLPLCKSRFGLLILTPQYLVVAFPVLIPSASPRFLSATRCAPFSASSGFRAPATLEPPLTDRTHALV